MRRNLFDNPFIIILLLITVFAVNTVASAFFVTIMLAGVVFVAFVRSLEKKYHYSLSLLVLAFCIIESNQGFALFSLSLFSYFSYIFILPYINKTFSINEFKYMIYIVWFYFGLFIFNLFFKGYDAVVFSKIMINAILDILVIGLLF